MKPRKIKLKTGTEILLGRNAENNDELVKQFKGKPNVILHTVAPGSPFCVIDSESEGEKPSKETIKLGGAYCAKYSQDWRDYQSDVDIHWFKGSSVEKKKGMEIGTFAVKKFKLIKVKKEDIEKWKK